MNKLKFVIVDRLTRARDNGEYFYRYLKNNHPEIDICFGLHPESEDWDRLKAEGFNLINLESEIECLKASIGCTHFLFSESNEGYVKLAKYLNRQKVTYIYLNHGCFFARGNICYPTAKFDYMICGNKREYDSVIYNATRRGLSTAKYLLTGLPRVDEQVEKYNKTINKNVIVIQPWWRNNLTGWRVVESTNTISTAAYNNLLNSDFVKGYNKLLNSPELKRICQANNLQVIFKRHPVMEHLHGVFNVPDWIIDEPNESFIDIFAKTKLYVTDYSSNAFETANLKIPCIYYEPDYYNLVVNCNRPEWAWNVKTDGLGPVAFNVDEFIYHLENLIKHNFVLDPVYQARRADQIAFFLDTNNCQRCFEAIMSKGVKSLPAQNQNINHMYTKVTTETTVKKVPSKYTENKDKHWWW